MGKVITKLLNDRWSRGGGKDVVAARECSEGGVETVERQDMVALQPTKWLNSNIINFVGKAMIQPRRGRGTAKVHVFNSHLMDKLLGGANPTAQYDFAAVEGWCDRIPGGVSGLDEIFIPVNPNGNHWNFIHVKMQEKQIELWDLLGLRGSNAKCLAATEKFVKDALHRETRTGGTGDNHSRQLGWESTDPC